MATTATFPQIVPTTRRFRMGDIPSTTYTSLSGAVFRRAFGNKKTNYTLDLTFVNITDTNTLTLIEHYEGVKGTFRSFALPEEIFSGMIDDLTDTIQAPSNVQWRYSRPLEVTSVKSNLSTLTISLVAEVKA